MNKISTALLFCMTFSFFLSAQNDERIKGDRNVTIKQTYIDPFNKIVVGEDFYVEVIYNKRPSVEVEADDNLHEFITFEVKDSVLVFKTTKKIVSSKKMNIKVNYGDAFQKIETRDDAEIRSLTSLELKNATLSTSGASKAYLNIKAESFKFESRDKARVKLNVTAKTSSLVLSDNSKLDAFISSPEVTFDLYQRSNADIEGAAKNVVIRTDNNSKFNGSNFTAQTCNLTSEISSDVYIEIIDSIAIEASGSSAIYLFGNPKITLNKFLDTAKLQKKVK
ncbi:GIN domain-containing protein [Flavobacteriaceae bacterium LMO-SS05]